MNITKYFFFFFSLIFLSFIRHETRISPSNQSVIHRLKKLKSLLSGGRYSFCLVQLSKLKVIKMKNSHQKEIDNNLFIINSIKILKKNHQFQLIIGPVAV